MLRKMIFAIHEKYDPLFWLCRVAAGLEWQ